MSNAQSNFQQPQTQRYISEGQNHGYHPMMHRNTCTGELQQVVLIEPESLQDLVAVGSYPELHFDLRRALGKFTKTQRVVLRRVLVEGLSVDAATHHVRGPFNRTSRWWAHWLTSIALPQLRADLADYNVDGKVVI